MLCDDLDGWDMGGGGRRSKREEALKVRSDYVTSHSLRVECRLLTEVAEVPGAWPLPAAAASPIHSAPPASSLSSGLPPAAGHLHSCPLCLDGLPQVLPLMAPCLSFPFKYQSDHPRAPQKTP